MSSRRVGASNESSTQLTEMNGGGGQQAEEPIHYGIDIEERIAYHRRTKNYIKANWLAFCRDAGPEKAKEALLTHVTSIGVVSALLAGLFVGGLDSPPQNSAGTEDESSFLMQFYAGCAALATVSELVSVMIVVIGYAYSCLHDADEIAMLLDSWAPTLVSQPVVLLAVGFAAGLVGIGIRLSIAWGSPIWQIYTACTGLAVLWILIMMVMFETITTKLRATRLKRQASQL